MILYATYLLSKGQEDEVCDATKAQSGNRSWYHNFQLYTIKELYSL